MKNYEPSKIKIDFGRYVRKLREERRLSQEELADLCDLDRTYIGGVERGERNVSLLNIMRIASGLQIDPAELFTPFAAEGDDDA